MQFLVIGLDGTDAKAKDRRLAVRQGHIELGEELRQAGNLWYGAALFDDHGNMNGSMYFVDFKNREELQAWLNKEPYVTGGVWKNIEIRKANVRDPSQFNRSKEFFEERLKKEET